MTNKIPLFGERRRENRARWERENQSSGTIQKYSEEVWLGTPEKIFLVFRTKINQALSSKRVFNWKSVSQKTKIA